MIRKLSKISEAFANERRNSPEALKRMEEASRGQSPDLLVIPSIRRGMQDIQLLGIKQGEAFFGTRISGFPLMEPDYAPTLAASPIAYNCKFPNNRGILLTFERNEPDELIRQSIDAVSSYPGAEGVPIVGIRVDYDSGRGRIVVHGKGRDCGLENQLLSRFSIPNPLDDLLLVVLCSDSRIQPPSTSAGAPMVIRTLGGYVPPFSGSDDETRQMNAFLSDWLSSRPDEKRMLVMAHGSFEGEGPSCGAGMASLAPAEHPSSILEMAILSLAAAAGQFEEVPAKTAEERVLSIARATKRNLFCYPAVSSLEEQGLELEALVDIALMDTVTNIVSERE